MLLTWYEQSQADVRPDDDWLSEWERGRLRDLRVPKRRADWRLGRWTAKLSVASRLTLPDHPNHLACIEVRPTATGAPEIYIGGMPAEVAVSLSHRGDRAVCVVGPAGARVGCDLEVAEPRSEAFIADYFTPMEQATIRDTAEPERYSLTALIWSAKESALKALGVGLRADTRSVSVNLSDSRVATPALVMEVIGTPGMSSLEWQPLSMTHGQAETLCGYCCCRRIWVRTVVAADGILGL